MYVAVNRQHEVIAIDILSKKVESNYMDTLLFDISCDVFRCRVEGEELLDKLGLEGRGGELGLEHEIGLVHVLQLVEVDLVVIHSAFWRLVTHDYK